MTREEEMSSKSQKQQEKHEHCAVDEKTTFTGYASSGGTNLHRITFSPRTLGPKDVEIDIWYSGVCSSDVHILEEDWIKLNGEVVPGHQIAGTVAAAGSEALYKVGDRVGASLIIDACMKCDECKAGQEQYCAKRTFVYNDTYKDGCPAPSYGGFANRVRLSSEFVYKLPDGLALSEAAPLFCSGLTTFTALRKHGAGADKTIGVMGIGAMGHLAIQYAKVMGSKEIVAIIDSNVASEDITRLGATRCVDLTNKDHIQAMHHKIDLLLVNSYDESTKWEDVLSMVSNHGTVVVLALSKMPMSIPSIPLAQHDIKIVSSFQGGRKDVKEMLDFTDKHEVHPWIVKVPFDKVNDALELQKKKTARYCIVLEADESKEKGSNVAADKPVAEQYLKEA